MTMRKLGAVYLFPALLMTAPTGCTLESPIDPANLTDDLFGFLSGLENQLENAIEDPLDTKPFPVLLGGNSQRLFYATNLGDIRINFPGPTNDIVLPGLLGPSNLYQFADKQRDLLRPLVPAGAFTSLATDGANVAFVAVTRLDPPIRVTVVAAPASLLPGSETILYDSDVDALSLLPGTLDADDARVVFALFDSESGAEFVRVVDLLQPDAALEIEVAGFVHAMLDNDRLLLVEADEDGNATITLRDLATDERAVVAENVRSRFGVNAFLTPNFVVWSDTDVNGDARVTRYEIETGESRVWAPSVNGRLTGAADDFFLTEEVIEERGEPTRIAVFRYNDDGTSKRLARFRADGLAGQSRIIGDRAVWVNKDRRIVVAPLVGGDRTIIKPF